MRFLQRKDRKTSLFRCQYQGMKPSKPRHERYFDAGSKIHVAFDLSYIK